MKIDEPLTKGTDGEYHCPKCEGVMKPQPRTFHWRGVYFAGLVCTPCNGLCDNPEDSFFEGMRKNVRGPCDIFFEGSVPKGGENNE